MSIQRPDDEATGAGARLSLVGGGRRAATEDAPKPTPAPKPAPKPAPTPAPTNDGVGGTVPGVALTHRQVLIVFSGLMLGMLLAALDQTIVATALPTIVATLHGGSHLSWVVSAYLLASTVTTPLYGKLSDLYGRKKLFQIAIVIFLAGSILSGLAHSIDQLIAFRALQGLGAGGLIALAMATIGDIVSPRQRGRYQGYFGAVFAFASVAGPLIGGLFTEHLSWRWVFYINVPLGIVALAVTTAVLRLPFRRLEHTIDYLGSLLLVMSVSALLLVTVWGGSQYAWGSGVIVGLAVAGTALLVVFVLWERVAPEPILPPRLFRNDIFSVAGGIAFLQAMAMFGSIVYVPFYLQIADGVTPTVSGLLLLPLMGGLLTMSITSGRLVSRTGRYKVFPVLGALLTALGLWLLTFLTTQTSHVTMSVYLFVLGAGMGMVIQNTVLAVQNAVAPRDMGTSTSALVFFRSLGAVFGTALFGVIFVDRVNSTLPSLLPARYRGGIKVSSSGLNVSPKALHSLPTPVRHAIAEAMVRALHSVYWVAVPFALLTIVLAVCLREIRLSDTSALAASAEAVPPTG
ncbi:MAG TPA: MDR family MFS transporter [Acidimicrobiales bacterium]|nr:MDR family MFS transporter [Acidimicrobiales bacterium]